MSKEKLVPEIRFENFEDMWKKTTIGDKVEVSSAARVHKNEWVENGIPFFRSSDVVSAFNKTDNEKAYIPVSLYEKLSYISGKVRKDDILVTGGGSIGIPYLVKNNQPFYFKDADLVWIKNSSYINGNFLYTFFLTDFFRKHLMSISHVTTISHYTIEQTKNTPIILPSQKEQILIGSYFKKLDNYIDKKNEELRKAKHFKQAMFQKMFPKEGETVPEVRFEGFEGEWKTKSLKDFLRSEFKGKAQAEKLSLGHNEYLDANRLNGGQPIRVNATKDVWRDDILILWDGSKAGTVYFGFEGVLGSTLKSFVVNHENHPTFVYQCLRGENHKIMRNYRTPNIPHVVRDFTETFKIPTPSFEEQKLIGNYFQNLDRNIETKQAELDKLKQFKQAMLDKMFV